MKMSMRITEKAKVIALSQGHKDPNAIIVCTDGARVPVWRFYYEAAKEQCEHDWKIWPETDGQSQRCMKCGEYRDTPADWH